MDSKGHCIDNIFVERLWRSLTDEEAYLSSYDSLRKARRGIGRYFDFVNHERPQQALGYQAPAGPQPRSQPPYTARDESDGFEGFVSRGTAAWSMR